MDGLRVPLSSITAEGFSVDSEIAGEHVQPPEVEDLVLVRARVWGVLTRAGARYLFRGHILGVFAFACDRCLEPAQASFETEVAWTFAQSDDAGLRHDAEASPAVHDEDDGIEEDGADDDTDIIVCHGGQIDLAPALWEEALLALPSKLLCRSDCAGLCTQCGANLNIAPCACSRAEEIEDNKGNKGFAGLADLFPDLCQDHVEEDERASTKEKDQ